MFMNKRLGIFLLITLYFAVAYALFGYYGITCVFREFLGVPCPGCGMTRALIALVNMDIAKALRYNCVIFFMPYIFIYIFFDLKSRVHNVLLMVIAIIAIVNWLIKIILYI